MSPGLDTAQRESVLGLCLMAAFADGNHGDAERGEIRRIAETLEGGDLKTGAVYQDVILGHASLETMARPLAGTPAAHFVYEMAACVCGADKTISPPEKDFLGKLRDSLGLEPGESEKADAAADSLNHVPVGAGTETETGADVEKMILNYAILNGALELLPQSMATMAVIPMQIEMVYRIGKQHGVDLDAGHIKELAATAGLGLTSQVVEGYARKLLKGLFGKKSMVGGLADQATSSAFSFAATFALGQVARSYYAGGRTMSSGQLRSLFDSTVAQARELHAQYLPQIRDKAAGLDLPKVLAELKSPSPAAA